MALLLDRGFAFRQLTLISRTRPSLSHRAFLHVTSKERTFKDAVALLDTLESNKQVVKTLSKSNQDANAFAIPEMLAYLRKAGYSPNDFKDCMKFIHIAGTKGKGSTCAMVESILLQNKEGDGRSQKNALGKVGLYTSPHLTDVRERIRIDGNPVSEQLFARYFFDLWDRFSSSRSDADLDLQPSYFRYLTILALHTFIEEGIETAIIECGIGGEYDSTNILPGDAVTTTAITSLGLDHVGMLGETIEQIAWHKAGIMKQGVPAFTVKQVPNAQAVLAQRASEKGVDLAVVEASTALQDVKLGLEGEFQRENAALAVSIATCHLRKLGISCDVSPPGPTASKTLPEKFINGLETVKWPGRCQVLKDGNITWCLDGAHTTDSLRAAATWFNEYMVRSQVEVNPPTATMLIFNQTDRDGAALLRDLMTALYTVNCVGVIFPRHPKSGRPAQRLGRAIFTYAAFPTNTPFMASTGTQTVDLKAQERLASVYQSLDGNGLHMSYASIEEAVKLAKRVSEGNEPLLVFVTGSLYLVGGVLQVLKRMKRDSSR
ncbi:FolC bifunctional protein [Stipitochalara longipes BDJ]|nr:FolC bifunctional protein [Stipitochalara longipes BDJ]